MSARRRSRGSGWRALCAQRAGEPSPLPRAPPSSAAASPGLQSAAGEAGAGTGHRTPGTRARLPDVVILLVMESPGSCCLGRFQHLLRKKWEALRETAKDVFCPQGPSSWGPGLFVTAERSLRHGTSQPCPKGGKNEQHRGCPFQDLPGLALSQRRGLCHPKTAKGTPLERRAPQLKENGKSGTAPWLWCPVPPFRALHSES